MKKQVLAIVALLGLAATVHAQHNHHDHAAHAATGKAGTYKVGSSVPGTLSFTDTSGSSHTFESLRGKVTVLEWINYGCPFVRKHYDSGNMQKLQSTYTGRGANWIGVISSAEGKQGYLSQKEAPAALAKEGFRGSTVALDAKGSLGRAFGAETTPYMVVIDATGKIVYTGAIDSIPSFNKDDISKADNYVAQAVEATLAGKAVGTATTKSYGCSVKY